MDVKVYKKEEVAQPTEKGEYFLVPDVIDLIPHKIETETVNDITNNVWKLKTLQTIADVEIKDGKLIINSNNVFFEDGKLMVKIKGEQILTVDTLDTPKDLLEQECSLATIWQKGLDPLDLEDGIQWSEAILKEVSPLILIEQITEAVHKVSLSVDVNFNVVELQNGKSVLTYSLTEVA